MFRVTPGMRVRAVGDIGGALGSALVRREMLGTVVDVRGWRTVMVQFDAGRCIGVDRWALRPVSTQVGRRATRGGRP